jgi:fucokinase
MMITKSTFDVIVITASNPTQLELFQLEMATHLTAGPVVVALCDPQGARVGSGGGTLNALVHTLQTVPDLALDKARILVLHSGGDSQRSPLCTVQGKAFSSFPHVQHKTPLALLLQVLNKVTTSPGVLISSTDVILHLPDLTPPVALAEDCIAGLGIWCPIEFGTRHGVFAKNKILQKPSLDVLRAVGFTDQGGWVDERMTTALTIQQQQQQQCCWIPE